MDSRERVLTALRGGEPDRVPCALGFFSQGLFGAADADEYFGTDVRFVEFAPPAGQDTFLEYIESLPPDVHMGSAAQLRTYHEWGYHPERDDARPVSRLLPRLLEPRRHAHLRDEVERLHSRGLAVAGSPPHLGGELFESAWRLRGFDVFMKDLAKRPEVVGYLLDQLETMATESACILGKAGVDILVLDDDVAYNGGLLISPAMWRRHFKPRLARIIAAARRAAAEGRVPEPAILYHCDGDFTVLLAELADIGVNAVNPVAPDCMDAAEIRGSLGERIAFWGTVGTAWAWDHGTPASIRDEVRARIASLGRRGLLLCPAYDLDFAPRDNVVAFVEAVREFGHGPGTGAPPHRRPSAPAAPWPT
jgi:uroporphyrinogen decarboxylase